MFDLLIPTYNRCSFLDRNLLFIANELKEYDITKLFRIIISDNYSTDSTKHVVGEFVTKHPQISVIYNRNTSNLGLEANAVKVLELARSEYVIFLGDDDFLDKGYLNYCVNKVQQNKNLGCIITGIIAVYENSTSDPRPAEKAEYFTSPGYGAVWKFSHLGHQLSGLVCRREGLLKSYLKHPEYRNPYLFLFFAAHSLYHFDGIYVPKYKTKVLQNNVKDWGYNKVGLLDEVYKCYYFFLELLPGKMVASLLIRFTVMHSYRLKFQNVQILYNQYSFLIKTTPNISNFRFLLTKLFIKELLLRTIKKIKN